MGYWFDRVPFYGCVWGAIHDPTCETEAARDIVTTHSVSSNAESLFPTSKYAASCFDPDGVDMFDVTATSGNFTLTVAGQTTGNIAWNASAATIKTALVALSNVVTGDLRVTTDADWPTAGLTAGYMYVTWTGAYVTSHPAFSANVGTLGGGTITLKTGRGRVYTPDIYDMMDVNRAGYAGGNTVGHNVDVIIHIVGCRTFDPTWPAGGHADIAAATYQDGSYVSKCLDKWVTILAGLPRPALVRMWHEMNDAGNSWSTDSNAGNTKANFIAGWKAVVDYFVSGGVRNKVRMIWCQGGHMANPTAASTWYWTTARTVGLGGLDSSGATHYVDWIASDVYSTDGNNWPSFVSGPQFGVKTFYDEFTLSEYEGKPLMFAEWGSSKNDPDRVIKLSGGTNAGGFSVGYTEPGYVAMLKNTFPLVKSVTWWDDSSNSIQDTPAGYLAGYRTFAANAYMNPPLTDPSGLVGWGIKI